MTRIVIIGGGPSGLVALKTLLLASTPERPLDPILLEAEDSIGGTFKWRSYEGATLVSSKQITSFSDFRLPLDHSDHLGLPEYVDYLGRYVSEFGLNDSPRHGTAWDGGQRMRMGCKVLSVERGVEGIGHRVKYRRRRPAGTPKSYANAANTGLDELAADYEDVTLFCDALAICTGLHVTAAVPSIPGFSKQIPESFHSSQYKSRSQLAGKKVLILGCGETAMDIGYDAVQAGAKEIVMCHRGGFLSFPKVLNDFRILGSTFEGALPIDGLITNLFETAYVHPWVAASHLRWFVSDFVIKRLLWFLTGTSAGCNQWTGALPPERLGRAYVFLNKSSRAMPYINREWKPRFRLGQLFASYIDPPADAQSKASISMATFPTHADEDGRVHFTPSKERKDYQKIKDRVIKPDLVVYCTGYKQDFEWLGEGYAGAAKADCREIVSPSDPSVAYLGFVRPGVGAIPPISELQAMWWTLLLQGGMPLPTSPVHYKLLASSSARIQYGVDHSSYSSQLARDMGAAPDLWELYRTHGLHVLISYCFGAAFVPFYRLLGPYKSPLAPGIARTELWDTITRRGFLGNLAMAVIPMIFYGWVSLNALILEQLWLHLLRPLLFAFGSLPRDEAPMEMNGHPSKLSNGAANGSANGHAMPAVVADET